MSQVWWERHRELLSEPPSASLWASLWAHWASAPPGDEALVEGYASAHLGGWDDALRQAPQAALVALERGERCPALARCTSLVWSGELRRLERLLERAELANLRALRLEGVPLDPWEVARLVQWPTTRRLRALGISKASLGVEGIVSLTAAELPELRSLELGGNTLGQRGLLALSQSDSLPRLEALWLGGNHLFAEAGAVIAGARWAPGLRALHLGGNFLEDTGLEELLSGCAWAHLELLELRHGFLEHRAGGLLAAAPLDSLHTLLLGDNNLGQAGAASLAEARWFPMLVELDLQSNSVLSDGAAALAAAPRGPRRLQLESNLLRDAGALALAAAPWRGEVVDLNLRNNELTSGSFAAWESPWKSLERLNLSCNPLTSAADPASGAQVAAPLLPLIQRLSRSSRLESLKLDLKELAERELVELEALLPGGCRLVR